MLDINPKKYSHFVCNVRICSSLTYQFLQIMHGFYKSTLFLWFYIVVSFTCGIM